jgi:phosphoglucosamine mutase
VLTNVRVASKAFEDSEAVTAAIRAGESELAGRGRLLVRPSGTESLIRVMVEAPTKPEATEVAGAVAQVVESELG